MKRHLILFVFLTTYYTAFAHREHTLCLNSQQIETLFLENNLDLLAERMNIDLAEAEIIQARLWDNPELSINDLNLWSSRSQREGESEVIPPLFGKYLKNTQFSIELSQLIQTANKRGKLIRREKVGKEIAIKEFEELLRALRLELRQLVEETLYMQYYVNILSKQQNSLQKLVQSYQKQVHHGNIPQGELIRLQSALLEIDNELFQSISELNKQLSSLKVLLTLPPTQELQISDQEILLTNPNDLLIEELLQQALEVRPDIQVGKLQTEYYTKSLAYEKSLRIPDITLSATYDRRGGVWRDFIGFGVSIDLPFLNRNQGGVKTAQITLQQSIHKKEMAINKLQHEVVNAFKEYQLAYELYAKTNQSNLLSEIERMQELYAKYLLKRDISMLEYIDFIESYKANAQTILTAKKQVKNQYQELQYILGTDIK